MEARLAKAEEIPYLKTRLAETDGDQVNLDTARVWVAVEQGEIVGLIAARMVWQVEPLLVFPELKKKMARRRATFHLYAACERWLGDREKNKTGIYWAFAVTRSRAVVSWAKQMKWLHQYKGTAILLKYF